MDTIFNDNSFLRSDVAIFPNDSQNYNFVSNERATVISIINIQSKYNNGFASISANLPDGKLVIIKSPRYETRHVGEEIYVEMCVNAKGKKQYKLFDKSN